MKFPFTKGLAALYLLESQIEHSMDHDWYIKEKIMSTLIKILETDLGLSAKNSGGQILNIENIYFLFLYRKMYELISREQALNYTGGS